MKKLEAKLRSYASALASKYQENKQSFPPELKKQKEKCRCIFTISQGKMPALLCLALLDPSLYQTSMTYWSLVKRLK